MQAEKQKTTQGMQQPGVHAHKQAESEVKQPLEQQATTSSVQQKGQQQVAQGQTGTSVQDVTTRQPLMMLKPEDIAKHNVGWLKERIISETERVRGISEKVKPGEEVMVYSKFGSWLDDGVSLKDLGSGTVYCHKAPKQEKGKFEVNLRLPGSTTQQITMNVQNEETIKELKEQVATLEDIPVSQQLVSFSGFPLLNEDWPIGRYRLPISPLLDISRMLI